MEKNKFEALLPFIVTALIKKIAEKKGISQDNSIELLYYSKLYAFLETEETKVWNFSVDKLLSLLEEETSTGNFGMPDY